MGRFFAFALPQGWQVQENTNLLNLVAPDGSAAIMVVGLVGMLTPFSPGQFVSYALGMHRMQLLQVLAEHPLTPAPGCAAAALFDILYATNNNRCRAIATCNVALGYGQCNAVMTLAAAREDQWGRYAQWLPRIAAEARPAGPQAMMGNILAANNLHNSVEFGQRLAEVNAASQAAWSDVTDQRWASDARNQQQFRETLGGVASYSDPYTGRVHELPLTHRIYWVNRQGEMIGTDDPSYDPRTGSTLDWTLMPRR